MGLQEPEERKVVTVELEEAKEPEQNEGEGARQDHQDGRERVVGLQQPEERKVVTVELEEAKEPEQNEREGAHQDHQDNQEEKDHKVLQDP